ncbi:Amino acid transporter ANTL3 [Capsicum baccatum]|uniref:Amino acid transporter ANTL3 n=1 Tax=Capsicum baccatum TaxID=33114 RepID=A0A2G2XBE2_CAPBA|nr:Amino acid transporter ANTL3 [Capsicum baccatum]
MKMDGAIDKYKERLVVKGFKQKEGLDYFNTYSPVMRITSIRMLIALAALYDLQIHQMDVKTVFLNGELEEKIYIEKPEGFVVPGKKNKECKAVVSKYRTQPGLAVDPTGNSLANKSFEYTPLFFYGLGVSVYAFESVGMILPLKVEMKDKDKFGKILGLYMAFISLMYGSFGVLGYFAFGEKTKEIITTNLGRGLLSTLVQIGLCINLFLTFPLMMNHVYEVIERRFCEGRYCFWLRWVVVLAVTLVALVVPNFDDFLSLVGSSVCIVLGFMLPAMFHLIVFKKELVWHGLAFALVLMGAVFAVYGTYSSMLEIFEVKA